MLWTRRASNSLCTGALPDMGSSSGAKGRLDQHKRAVTDTTGPKRVPVEIYIAFVVSFVHLNHVLMVFELCVQASLGRYSVCVRQQLRSEVLEDHAG